MVNLPKVLCLFAVVPKLIFSAELPIGFLDPEPILQAAEHAIGAQNINCVEIEGTAIGAAVGQAYLNGYEVDWPPGKTMNNYKRFMNWSHGAMLETFEREPGFNPASWKYGSGWRSGTPLQKHKKQEFGVVEDIGWSRDGEKAEAQQAYSEDADVWQLDLWMNPHGFLKAARLPGANPVATWRWELGEMGRDGPTTQPEKVRIISITILGKYQVNATINKNNLLQRIHTRVGDPVLGDFNYEHEFQDSSYVDLDDDVRFPTYWHHHQGWDDNYQTQSINAGHNAFGGILDKITVNNCRPIDLPQNLNQPTPDNIVEVTKLADGIWLLGGASHNSVAVEFPKYVVVVEAPLNEERSLSVIDSVSKLIPGKPIRFLVNTHQHHDHIGGLRTYMHIGATIITHWKNYEFYTRDVLNYAPRSMSPDMLSMWPPTELAEGYQYETMRENYWLSSNTRSIHLSYVHPLKHVEGMVVAYLPTEKILIQADLFNTLESSPSESAAQLKKHVQVLGLEVESIVPIHGAPVKWEDFVHWLNSK